MDTLAQDFRYAVRQLMRAPAFTIVAVLTLAIGIGANTALFTLANAVFSRPAPGVRADARTVWIAPFSTRGGHGEMMSYPDFLDYRDSSGVFEQAAVFGNVELSLSGGGQPERLRGQIVSGSYFSILGVSMAAGRGFTADEDAELGAHPVAVVSYHLWQERFGASPSVLGRTIIVDALPFTIVGVAPEHFSGADLDERRRDVWIPIGMQPVIAPSLGLTNRGAWWLAAIGRLKPDVSTARARSAVATVAARIAAEDSANHAFTTATVEPLRGGVRPNDMNDIAPVATLAAVATGLILLICCANVSNMLLGQAVGRRREIGVRLSLGATRGRIVRQLLTESLMLGVAASVCGFILSAWATDALTATMMPFLNAAPEGHTIAFAIVVAVVVAMLFGIAPALHATRSDLVTALKDSAVGFDRRRSRLQGSFVIAQVSLSLVLLVMSGMFLNALYRAAHVQMGFEATSHVLAASFDLELQGYTPERASAFITTLERQVTQLPGVVDVSVTNDVPMGERRNFADVALDPKELEQTSHFGERGGEVYENVVRPTFFHTLGIGMVAGRDFNAMDVPGSAGEIIVSEDFAQRAWPGANPIGKHVSVSGQKGPFLAVIGVARAALTFGLGERARPVVYRSQLQFPQSRDATLLVRSSDDATLLAPAIRRTIRALDPNLPIYALKSLGQYRRDRLSDMAFGSTLLAIIGALAVSLASVGLYAVIAFAVSQRQREIGIRIALGAARQHVVRMFVAQGMRVTIVGVAVGATLSAGMVKVLASAFVGVVATDLIAFAGIAGVLVAIAALASWIPARRAARVDPMVALRAE
jgi:putative ABC transport system permease protein